MTQPWDLMLRHVCLLSGALALANNAATALHELGHAIAMWATGGKVRRITLHPFSWSHTFFGSAPRYPRLTTWAGAAFGIVVGGPLLTTAWLWPSPWLMACTLAGICSLAGNGVYLAVDALWRSGGDGTQLVGMGTRRSVVVTTGALLLAAGVVCAISLLRSLGLTRDLDLAGRMAVLFLGFGPYLAAIGVYHWLFNRREALLWSTYVAVSAVLLSALACLPPDLGAPWAFTAPPDASDPSWTCSLVTLACGVVLVVLLLRTPVVYRSKLDREDNPLRRLAEHLVSDCAAKGSPGFVVEVFDDHGVHRLCSTGAVVANRPAWRYVGDPLASLLLSLYAGEGGAGRVVVLDGRAWRVTASPVPATPESDPGFKRGVAVEVKRIEQPVAPTRTSKEATR